jgi:hypothetical protein
MIYRINISDYITAYRFSDFAVEASSPDEARERAEAFIEWDRFEHNFNPSRFALQDTDEWEVNSIVEVKETVVWERPGQASADASYRASATAPAEGYQNVLYTEADWQTLQAETGGGE